MGIYGYINPPYYWVDDHPIWYGNNGNLDPGTYVTKIQIYVDISQRRSFLDDEFNQNEVCIKGINHFLPVIK